MFDEVIITLQRLRKKSIRADHLKIDDVVFSDSNHTSIVTRIMRDTLSEEERMIESRFRGAIDLITVHGRHGFIGSWPDHWEVTIIDRDCFVKSSPKGAR